MMNPLYKDVRGKVITDYYSEDDLNMLGFDLSEFSITRANDDYQTACSLYYDARTIEDTDLEEAALSLIREMQEKEGCGQE